ncbi:MAG TPA: biotin carboxylase N-terminal domain-containing protein [Pseudomonadales bacterium]
MRKQAEKSHKIGSLLVANRGEIALRVMRTAKAQGIHTVAVYSEADAQAPHVLYADDAVCIGPAPVLESYLKGETIIQAALDKGADAIHPGYGFLSENAAFARAVAEAGIVFVGPPAAAIEVMGDKARAKRRMIEAGVPCVPGYEDEDQSDDRLIAAAEDIGYPIMVKAAAGGGGRGMRLVQDASDLPRALKLARSEAANAFGSGDLILEKAIVRPRHVEIQVFADQHGNVLHLGERDCSVQRRHQKVVEEAPCPVMTQELRAAMGEAAVEAVRTVNYLGAGTVEFLLDEAGHFYFLEMNTRLQVEHPVTELVTGLDLVALQLAVAEGRRLGIEQSDVRLEGHAIEVRLYAEDPAQDFLPATGPIHLWRPAESLRVDAGVASGGEVSPFYDSMVAKLIAYGETRDAARRKLIEGLGQTALFGTATNRDFLIDVLGQPAFADGGATTAFIGEVYGEAGWQAEPLSAEALAVAGLIEHGLGQRSALAENPDISAELLDWSSTADLETVLRYDLGEESRRVSVRAQGGHNYQVMVDDVEFPAELLELDRDRAVLSVNGRHRPLHFWRHPGGRVYLALPERTFDVIEVASVAASGEDAGGDGVVLAPMHGQLLEVLVAEGDRVRRGDKLAVLEAMKMQHEILANVDGTVTAVLASAGTQIAADERILEIEPDAEAE